MSDDYFKVRLLYNFSLIKLLTLSLTLLAGSLTTVGQFTVNGTVLLKEDNVPLAGVNVVEKGTTIGTSTASDGTFSLTVSDSNSILIFSFIGMVSQEYPLNGKDNIVVKMKVDCIRDYFDTQKIIIYGSSGIVNNPIGAQLDLAFPYFGSGTLNTGLAFQTNVDKNKFLNAQIDYNHFVSRCNFDLDIKWNFREVSYDNNNFNSKVYSFETDLNVNYLFWNINYLKFIAGFGKLDLNRVEQNISQSSVGPLVGLGTWVGNPLRLYLTGKAGIYGDYVEYQGQITRRFKRINSFVRYYKLDSFTELSLGIGVEVGYRIRRKTK